MNSEDRARQYPVLRENVWLINPATATSLMITSAARYEVPEADARRFLKMRSYCTGYQSKAAIAAKSGLTVAEVEELVDTMDGVDVLRRDDAAEKVDPSHAREMLQRGCTLWGEELTMMNMGNQFMSRDLPREAFTAWLVELVHFYRALPATFKTAARHCTSPAMTPLLNQYADLVAQRETPLRKTLSFLGVSAEQLDATTPMLATRLIDFLMRELFETLPATALLVTSVIEACALDQDQCEALVANAARHYALEEHTLAPFLDLQRTMMQQGQAHLLATHRDLITIDSRPLLDRITNQLHDLVHAFFLLSDEIRQYYQPLQGKYLFRQPVDFAAL